MRSRHLPLTPLSACPPSIRRSSHYLLTQHGDPRFGADGPIMTGRTTNLE